MLLPSRLYFELALSSLPEKRPVCAIDAPFLKHRTSPRYELVSCNGKDAQVSQTRGFLLNFREGPAKARTQGGEGRTARSGHPRPPALYRKREGGRVPVDA